MSAADTPIDLTHKQLPVSDEDEGRRHRWADAPPGAGRGQTCRVCGQRRAVVGDLPCPGRHSGAVTETLHDYDPFG